MILNDTDMSLPADGIAAMLSEYKHDHGLDFDEEAIACRLMETRLYNYFLAEYLEHYHLNTGYLISFCFNQNKQPGVRKTAVDGKRIIEAIV